jgi:hypothetical protein
MLTVRNLESICSILGVGTAQLAVFIYILYLIIIIISRFSERLQYQQSHYACVLSIGSHLCVQLKFSIMDLIICNTLNTYNSKIKEQT